MEVTKIAMKCERMGRMLWCRVKDILILLSAKNALVKDRTHYLGVYGLEELKEEFDRNY